ncbi:MAG: hypothetical protein U0168_11290 [Nannocystaceae bacterium]
MRGGAIVPAQVALVALQAEHAPARCGGRTQPRRPHRRGTAGAVHAEIDVEPQRQRRGLGRPRGHGLGCVGDQAHARVGEALRQRDQLGHAHRRQRVREHDVDREPGLRRGAQHQRQLRQRRALEAAHAGVEQQRDDARLLDGLDVGPPALGAAEPADHGRDVGCGALDVDDQRRRDAAVPLQGVAQRRGRGVHGR